MRACKETAVGKMGDFRWERWELHHATISQTKPNPPETGNRSQETIMRMKCLHRHLYLYRTLVTITFKHQSENPKIFPEKLQTVTWYKVPAYRYDIKEQCLFTLTNQLYWHQSKCRHLTKVDSPCLVTFATCKQRRRRKRKCTGETGFSSAIGIPKKVKNP